MTAPGIEAALADLDRSRRVGWARAYEAERRIEGLEQHVDRIEAAHLGRRFVARTVEHLLASGEVGAARWLLWLDDGRRAVAEYTLSTGDIWQTDRGGGDSLYFACVVSDYYAETRPWFPGCGVADPFIGTDGRWVQGSPGGMP